MKTMKKRVNKQSEGLAGLFVKYEIDQARLAKVELPKAAWVIVEGVENSAFSVEDLSQISGKSYDFSERFIKELIQLKLCKATALDWLKKEDSEDQEEAKLEVESVNESAEENEEIEIDFEAAQGGVFFDEEMNFDDTAMSIAVTESSKSLQLFVEESEVEEEVITLIS